MPFVRADQVWAKNPFRKWAYWPAVVVDPNQDVPKDDPALRKASEGACVMFYGPSCSRERERDYHAHEGEEHLMLWDEANADLKNQFMPNDDVDKHFQAALDEAEAVETNSNMDPVLGASHVYEVHDHEHMPVDDIECASCGKPADPRELATRQGRCKSCQALFEKRKYCGVCMRVWFPQDNDMVCCDNCNLWIHADCDPEGQAAVQDEEGDGEYFCPKCNGTRSEAQANATMLSEYESRLREMKPPKPRSAFLLFSGEMIRLYRKEQQGVDYREMVPIIANAWRNLNAKDQGEYANAHLEETAIYQVQNMQYEAIFEEYEILAANNDHDPPGDLIPDARAPALLAPPPRAPSGAGSKRPPPHRPSNDDEAPVRKQLKQAMAPVDLSGLPAEIAIVCNSVRGYFVLATQKVQCRCKDCAKKPEQLREFTPTQFEQHCGAGSAKKWKASLRLEQEAGLEPPGMQIGKWLELKGVDTKGSRPHGEGPGRR